MNFVTNIHISFSKDYERGMKSSTIFTPQFNVLNLVFKWQSMSLKTFTHRQVTHRRVTHWQWPQTSHLLNHTQEHYKKMPLGAIVRFLQTTWPVSPGQVEIKLFAVKRTVSNLNRLFFPNLSCKRTFTIDFRINWVKVFSS